MDPASEALSRFKAAVAALVKDRLRLPLDELLVDGSHELLPELLQSIEGLLGTGVYDGSHWWDCFNQVLSVLKHEGGLAAQLNPHVGEDVDAARSWIIASLQSMPAFEAFFERLIDMQDVLQAYYTPESALGNVSYQQALQKVVVKLTPLTFVLKPRDIRFFDEPTFPPPEARPADRPLVTREKKRAKKPKRHADRQSPRTDPSPVPSGCGRGGGGGSSPPVPSPLSTSPAAAARQFPRPPTAAAAAQTDRTLAPVSLAELGRRLNAAQKRDVVILRREMAVRDRKKEVAAKERAITAGKEAEKDFDIIKEMLKSLSQLVPRASLSPRSQPIEDLDAPTLASRVGAMLEAAHSRPQKGLPPQFKRPSSPALASAGSSLSGSRTTLSGPSCRARSHALSPNGNPQVLLGDGINTLDFIKEDFFGAGNDDGELLPPVAESFNGSDWIQFEGLDTEEKGDVQLEHQLAVQHNRCAGCASLFHSSMLMRGPRLCRYTGKYFCSKCHKGRSHVLPASVIHRWDFTPQKVCEAAHWHLRKTFHEPLLYLDKIRPQLKDKIDALKEAHKLRVAIVRVVAILPTSEIETVLSGSDKSYEHFLIEDDLYSMHDLNQLHSDCNYNRILRRLLTLSVRKAETVNSAQVHYLIGKLRVDDQLLDHISDGE
ncbi:Differentially expressed in FDCP 8-like protein [Diplonema papillatum]|nr:Differentially expressed in FDCP 8-like protein [Diplonema papillatum]